MPWCEVSVMDQRREFVRLPMQEGANRRELCRRRLRMSGASNPVGPTCLRNLDASVGASGPHDFAVRISAVRLLAGCSLTGNPPCNAFARRRCRVHRIPLRVRDDREPPLWEQDGRAIEVILATAEAKYFCERGWTLICSTGGFLHFAWAASVAFRSPRPACGERSDFTRSEKSG
jgi:hypothetical protein